MITKILKKTSVFIVLLTLWACPSLDPCVASGGPEITKPNLIKISPLQDLYSVGDEIIISITITSVQNFPNETIDIYQKTHIENEKLQNTELHKIIEHNDFTILEGNYENYMPILHYYSSENEYRFKIKVVLNELNNYSLYAGAEIYFKDPNDDCISYGINTNIEGMNEENRKIEFRVE